MSRKWFFGSGLCEYLSFLLQDIDHLVDDVAQDTELLEKQRAAEKVALERKQKLKERRKSQQLLLAQLDFEEEEIEAALVAPPKPEGFILIIIIFF